MDTLTLVGLVAMAVCAAFGGICAYGCMAFTNRPRDGAKGSSVIGALLWGVVSGAAIWLLLRRMAAPTPEWPYPRDQIAAPIAPMVGSISVAGAIVGLAFHRLRPRR